MVYEDQMHIRRYCDQQLKEQEDRVVKMFKAEIEAMAVLQQRQMREMILRMMDK